MQLQCLKLGPDKRTTILPEAPKLQIQCLFALTMGLTNTKFASILGGLRCPNRNGTTIATFVCSKFGPNKHRTGAEA